MGQIRASHYNKCNHHDGITGSFVLPFPLPSYPSLTFSYSCSYARSHVHIYRNVYDVSRRKCEAYGSGRSYAVLPGKDESRSWTVSMSSLRTEDAVTNCSMLKEKVCETFDDWLTFFTCIFPCPTPSRSTIGSDMVLSTVSLNGLASAASATSKWTIIRVSWVV
jgi:hypothetical protein